MSEESLQIKLARLAHTPDVTGIALGPSEFGELGLYLMSIQHFGINGPTDNPHEILWCGRRVYCKRSPGIEPLFSSWVAMECYQKLSKEKDKQ